MKTHLTWLVLLACSAANAQNDKPVYQYGFKLYNLFSYGSSWPTDGIAYRSTETKNTEYLHPTFAFELRNRKGRWHEFELTEYTAGQQRATSYIDSSSVHSVSNMNMYYKTRIALRYEYALWGIQSGNGKLQFSLNAGASLYYYKDRGFELSPFVVTPGTPLYSNKIVNVGVRVYAIPRLRYFAGDRFYLDMNVPVCLVEGYLDAKRVPTNSPNPTYWENIKTLPKLLSARVGAGFRF